MSSTGGLKRLFSPESVAVIGGRVAESVIEELTKLGYPGEIWPVNPNRPAMAGIPCVQSVEALPAPPDAVYLGIPGDRVVAAVRSLSKIGAGGVICHASGFSEAGDEGEKRSAALIAAAKGMPVVGPNCWGMLNLMNRVALWPDFHGGAAVDTGVAIISQSGNMSINYTMQRRALSLAMVITLGNQLMIDASDCMEILLEDDRITAIGLHIEGLGDVERFSRLAIRAAQQKKPVVVLKTGISDKGARATISHTATLAGADELYDALFKRYGIARVYSVPAFLETLKFLSIAGVPHGSRVATLSCSGGEASLLADRIASRSLYFPELAAPHRAAVRKTLNEYVDVTNPLDYHTFIWGDRQAMHETFSAMLAGQFDIAALILDYPREDRSRTTEYDMAVDAWIAASRANAVHTAVVATLPECMPEPVAQKLVNNGITPFFGVEEFLDACDAAQSTGNCDTTALKTGARISDDTRTLSESESKALLKNAGLSVVESCLTDSGKAVADAENIGYPVVLKVTDVPHKTEVAGVRLNLHNADAVEEAARELGRISAALLLEKMIPAPACELIVGVKRDAQFGLVLVVGAGGIFTELLQDSVPLLFPVSRTQIDDAIKGLRINKLLNGYRNQSVNRDRVIDAVEKVARFAWDQQHVLQELDINPLMAGEEVMVADALIIVRR